MLDFQVQLALGDEELYRGRMARTAGRRRGAGAAPRPVGRSRPRQADRGLDHWKLVEQQAADGLSFIEGMRLLAGAPRDLADDGDDGDARREWAFVQAGNWLGECWPACDRPRIWNRPSPAPT